MLITQAGCYNWIAIQPAEIGKLHPGSVDMVGSTSTSNGRVNVYAVSKQYVTKEDGTTFELTGQYDLRLDTGQKKPLTVKHPVLVTPGEGAYQVQGSNLPSTTINSGDIRRAEVSQLSEGKSAVLAVVLVTVGALLAIGIPVATAH